MLIETDRLRICNYHEDDWEAALLYLGNEETMHYLPEDIFTESSVKEFIAKQKNMSEYFAVTHQEDQKVIGHLFFASFFGEHSYEIGWVFNQEYGGQGFAKEAAEALLDYGFNTLKIHRVIATCQPENERSYRLMERLGMRREGHFKECIPVKDGWWDEYYYAILDHEWEAAVSR